MAEYANGGFIGSFGGKAEHFWVGPDETVISQADLLRIGYPESVIDEMRRIRKVESDEEADE